MSLDSDIRALPINERAAFKANEIKRVSSITTHRSTSNEFGFKIEIRSITTARNYVEVFLRAWDSADEPIGFGDDGSIEIEKHRVVNPPVLVSDPLGTVIRVTPFGILQYREDPEHALIDALAHTISVVGIQGNVEPGKVGRTTSTLYPNAGTGTAPVDGNVERDVSAETWSTIRSGAGTGGNDTDTIASIIRIDMSATTDRFNRLIRSIYGFDTSVVGSDTISSSTFSSYGNSKENGAGDVDSVVMASTPNSESAIVAADYAIGDFGTTEFGRVTYANWSTSGYNDHSLNASGISHIDGAGNTYFGQMSGPDFDNSEPSWSNLAESRLVAYMADDTGTTRDPKLVVVHAAATLFAASNGSVSVVY